MWAEEDFTLNYYPPTETFWPEVKFVPVNQPVQPEASVERWELMKKFDETMKGIVFK